MKRVLMILLFLGFTANAYAQEPRGLGLRLGVSNEGAPDIGADYLLPLATYLYFLPSVDSRVGDQGPWLSADLAVRIPVWTDHAIFLGGGIASVAGEYRGDSQRVLASEFAVVIGGRGYFFVKTAATEERRIAIGGGFRF